MDVGGGEGRRESTERGGGSGSGGSAGREAARGGSDRRGAVDGDAAGPAGDEFAAAVGEDHEFIRHVIESMLDVERDLDVLFFDGPDRGRPDDDDDDDKADMDDNDDDQRFEWRRRPDDNVRVNNAEAVLRDVGREVAIQRGLRAARAFRREMTLSDHELLLPTRSAGFSLSRASPHPMFHEFRCRDDEAAEQSSSALESIPAGSFVSSRKFALDEARNARRGRCVSANGELDPPLPLKRPPHAFPRGYLYCGSRFRGAQRSRSHRFEVEVVIQDVDLAEAKLYGTLRTKGLTSPQQEFTTFFDGEIISEKFPFVTNKWEADVEADENHWNKFPGFKEKYGTAFSAKPFDYSRLLNDHVMFMRWKEHHLVDDGTRPRDVMGASFAGFYYITLDEIKGEIMGFYYHRQSELYQLLSLKHIDQTVFDGCEIR